MANIQTYSKNSTKTFKLLSLKYKITLKKYDIKISRHFILN